MDDVGVLGVEHRLVVLIGPWDAVALLEVLAALAHEVAHGDHLHVADLAIDVDVFPCPRPAAEQAGAVAGHGGVLSG